MEVHSVPDLKRPPFEVATKGPFRPAQAGESFGPSWATYWFKIAIKVPDEWKKAPQVLFHWDIGNEGLVFAEDGTVQVGLSGEERQEWLLPKSYQDGHWHTFYIESSCNAMFGNADPNDNIQPPTDNRYYKLKRADLILPNIEGRALKYDFLMIEECAKCLPEGSWQKYKALEIANKIMDTFDECNIDESIKACRTIAQEFIGTKVDSTDVFKDSKLNVIATAVGHCHIDTAWLWPYAETRRKVGRSWATQLDLIERYPEYNFVCSQAIQYQWLKEDYPELFERLKKAIKNGRFIPIGGSWVESDTNMPSGESIARQFLYGQRFFEDNFGVTSKTYWLPDTFGYSAQIPQLCQLAGMDRFVTQKLSWNNINNFPNTTFNWVALDGSQVVCHMPPADTYNCNCTVNEYLMNVSNHKNRDITQSALMLFGHGDGGGGPTVEMLERMRRARGIADTVEGLPRVEMNGNVDNFFDKVLETTGHGKDLVSWVGELYFEFHRGTYTSQANTKKYNRTIEVLLHDLEYLATMVSLTVPEYKYPKKDLDKMWGLLLLNQFHDVLPGSSIELVYKDVDEIASDLYKTGQEVLSYTLNSAGIASGAQESAVAINTLPWSRKEVVKVDKDSVPAKSLVQSCQDGVFTIFEVAENGTSVAALPDAVSSSLDASVREIKKGVYVLENAYTKITIEKGVITSFHDVENKREVLRGGPANRYQIFDDEPLNWQGWDTEVYSLKKYKYLPEGKVSILDKGPLRASVLIEQKISDKSWIKSVISLDAVSNVNKVDISAEVEWNEACKFLKVEFPVDVHSDYATYDSMYGAVKRPTHYNTYWDVAKFEVCCHKYADLSDYTYGVSILNDSKYGFATHGNVMRLSLLRAPKAPDAHADMGRHHIKWSIFPHKGSLSSQTVRAAYDFNYPLKTTVSTNTEGLKFDLVNYKGDDNVILSAIKRAEDDADVVTEGRKPKRGNRKNVIVRLYESLGGRSRGRLETKVKVAKAFKCNILENDIEEISVDASQDGSLINIELRAFEIASYRLELA